MRSWQLMLSAAAVGLPICAAPAGAQPDAVRQAQLTHLVRHDCGSCHGMTLKGGLGGPLLPADLEHYSSEDVALLILEGVPGKPMPPWRGQLTGEDALWIAEQLKKGLPQ